MDHFILLYFPVMTSTLKGLIADILRSRLLYLPFGLVLQFRRLVAALGHEKQDPAGNNTQASVSL